MRPIILSEDGESTHTPGQLFNISDVTGREADAYINKLLQTQASVQQKVKKIIKVKNTGNQLVSQLDELGEIKDTFMYDGGIRLSEKDLNDIVENLYLVDGSSKTQMNTTEDNPYIQSLCHDFCYFRWNSLNFRNDAYYFLFDSLKVEPNGVTTSINDFNITSIDLKKFQQDINRHYNRIDQHLRLFLDFFSGMTISNIANNFDAFHEDVQHICFPEKIDLLEAKIKSLKFAPDDTFNAKMVVQNLNLVSLLREFMQIIDTLVVSKNAKNSPDFYRKATHLIELLNIHSIWFSQIKSMFHIDIDAVLRKYVYIWTFPAQKKIILGLLDAKINILAFMQNMTQILYNQNFLDVTFPGDLVLRKDQTEYLAKVSPDVIASFKQKQSEVTHQSDANRYLAMELDASIWYFTDILIGDKPEAYVYAASLIPSELKEIHEGYSDESVELFEPAFDLMESLLNGLERYSQQLDAPKHQKYNSEIERNRKKAEKGKTTTPPKPVIEGKNKNYLDAKSAVFKKLFRLHREENHPLAMIKTAQNAYIHIVNTGYDHTTSLHILSVNYGGSLVGYFAKHTFERLSQTGGIMVNIGNIIYSIYDLKNANDFLGIVDYPFHEFMNEFRSADMKQFFQERNHLLIFDDNTSSGRTLNDLRELALRAEVYGKVDVFACRANPNIDIYDPNISEELKLHLIRNAALETRKTRVGTIRRGYKELVGAWIGNSLYKSWYRGGS